MELSEELQTLHSKVQRFLREMDLEYSANKDWYRVQHQSTAIILHPLQWHDQDTILKVVAIVLLGVKKAGNEAMFEEFSRIHEEYVFGKIFWKPDDDKATGNIYLEHNLLGETLDFDQFKSAIVSLALTADELDDALKAKFGGKRFADD